MAELRSQDTAEKNTGDGSRQYHIVLADDHEKFREWLRSNLADQTELEVVGEAEDGSALLSLLGSGTRPDMVIMDISMPNLNGLEASKEIKRLYPGMKIMVLTAHDEKEYQDWAFAAGADGYLLKERTTDLSTAINTIRKGGVYHPFRAATSETKSRARNDLRTEDTYP